MDFERDILLSLEPWLRLKVDFGALMVALPTRVIAEVERWQGGAQPKALEVFYTDRGIDPEARYWESFRHLRLRRLLREGYASCVVNLVNLHGISFDEFATDVVMLEAQIHADALLAAVHHPADRDTLERKIANRWPPRPRGQAPPMPAPSFDPVPGGQPLQVRADSGRQP